MKKGGGHSHIIILIILIIVGSLLNNIIALIALSLPIILIIFGVLNLIKYKNKKSKIGKLSTSELIRTSIGWGATISIVLAILILIIFY